MNKRNKIPDYYVYTLVGVRSGGRKAMKHIRK